MLVKDLIAKLQQMPQDAEVVHVEWEPDFESYCASEIHYVTPDFNGNYIGLSAGEIDESKEVTSVNEQLER